MRTYLRWLIVGLVALLMITACTRNRTTPEPTAMPTLPAAPVTGDSGGADPAVAAVTETPAEGPEVTPTAEGVAETFQYVVRTGETLSAIARKFETDVGELRRLNNLLDDSIFVGQVIDIPYVEGMTAEGAPTATPAPYRYTVASGDTIASIAARFGVTTINLIEVNGLIDPNNLVVGQELIIPGLQATAPVAGGTPGAPGSAAQVTHVVQPGESLSEIATAYGVDPGTIAAVNNIANRNLLRAGQQLIIPGVTQQQAAERRGTTHVVQAGESLLSIANQYGVTIGDILQVNAITNPDEIYVGQELIIPTGG